METTNKVLLRYAKPRKDFASINNADWMPFHKLSERLTRVYGEKELRQKVKNGELTIVYFSGKYTVFLDKR